MQELFSMKGPFARFMNLMWDLICISIAWFVCSIPVVTLGAASTAAYYAAAKVIRHHTGHIFSEFFSSFKVNFKQSTLFTLLCAAVLLILVFDCVYFYNSSLFFLYLFYLMILMVTAIMCWFFPLLSRFSMSVFRFFRMAAVISFRHLLSTILLLLLLIAAILGIYLMPWGILVFPGTVAFASTFVVEPILRKYAPTPEEGSEEAGKWYYQ